MPRLNSPEELEQYRQGLLAARDPGRPCISVCTGSACLASGAAEVLQAFREEITRQGLAADVDTRGGGCPGFCGRGPVVVIYPAGICYLEVSPGDVGEIISRSVREQGLVERLLYADRATSETAPYEQDIPFYKHQQRLLLGHNMQLDPTSIDDYLALGGYAALAKALGQMSPEQVIAEVYSSGLRGRSGSGFSAGFKWDACRKSTGGPKYIICNCHEGDPGAYADRRVLESNPHTVLEGMIIGAYAIGASTGYVFVGDEFPRTVENIRRAIRQAEEYGFLGKNILGSGFDFSVEVYIDGGGYVLGESTALMASMEGRIGEPRTKYDHATDSGLWAKPTVLNNLQTWANVPLIIGGGADAYCAVGTEGSKGTRIFSLTGKVKNSGMVEVPMGMTLRDVIYKIGGGIRDGGEFKALQVGGPLGGFVPESLLDLKVDYDELKQAGLAMGPGLIVADGHTCIVDMVSYFLKFLSRESCGKCTPCRDGLRQMLTILHKIAAGEGEEGDLELLEQIARVQKRAALCALGQGASDPLLTTLRHFREEYAAHIGEKNCPAGVCRMLFAAGRE